LFTKKHALLIIIETAAALTAGSSALADVFVVSSNSQRFHVGETIQESASIDLADQEQLRVLSKNTGETQLLIGPYKGSLSQYKAPCTSEGRLSLECRTPKRSKPIAASRGLKKGAPEQ
jgi:hypothetical protein